MTLFDCGAVLSKYHIFSTKLYWYIWFLVILRQFGTKRGLSPRFDRKGIVYLYHTQRYLCESDCVRVRKMRIYIIKYRYLECVW